MKTILKIGLKTWALTATIVILETLSKFLGVLKEWIKEAN